MTMNMINLLRVWVLAAVMVGTVGAAQARVPVKLFSAPESQCRCVPEALECIAEAVPVAAHDGFSNTPVCIWGTKYCCSLSERPGISGSLKAGAGFGSYQNYIKRYNPGAALGRSPRQQQLIRIARQQNWFSDDIVKGATLEKLDDSTVRGGLEYSPALYRDNSTVGTSDDTSENMLQCMRQ